MMVMLDCSSVLSALVFAAISFRRVLSVMVILDCRSVLSAAVFESISVLKSATFAERSLYFTTFAIFEPSAVI